MTKKSKKQFATSTADAGGKGNAQIGITRDLPLMRAAKGKRPSYFKDPAVDKLHMMLMVVVEELSVARDRIDTLERLIEQHGLFDQEQVETYFPDTAADAERSARRIAYIKRIMKGVTDELEQFEREKDPLEFQEVVEIVSQ